MGMSGKHAQRRVFRIEKCFMAKNKADLTITLRDVAKAAGVGLATASRAMRDDPATRESTREKVKKAAARLGYRPDPGMAHLIERRWRGKRREGGMNIGYLLHSQCENGDMSRRQYKQFKDVSERMGYVLIEEDLSQFSTCKKLSQRLWVQGVEGLLVCLLPSVPFDLNPVFKKFPAVSISVSQYRPSCAIIMHDEFTAITEVWNELQRLGYEKIGVILPDYPNSTTTDLRLGAILTCRSLQKPAKNKIPILYHKTNSRTFETVFRPWMEKYQPEVVIGYEERIAERIEKLGFGIPDDVAYATYNLWGEADLLGKVAGYYRDNDGLCIQGLQLLNMMIRSGRVGSQSDGLVEMVAGEWRDGPTLPRINARAPK